MARRTKNPALELPGIFIEAISKYMGPRAMNGLSSDGSRELFLHCASLAGVVAERMTAAPRPKRSTKKPADAPDPT